jgi:hypothetical protein
LLTLQPGYNGVMQWSYKNVAYTFQLGQRLQKASKDFEIDWSSPKTATPAVDELYRGIVSYFTPDLYTDTPTDCNTNGTCLVYPPALIDGIHPLVGFRPAAFYFYLQDPAKNAGNLVWYAYAFAIKFPPYGLAAIRLKNDLEGPSATIQIGNEVGTNKKCVLDLGGSFQDLLDNCVNVFDPKTNETALNKVIGGLSHDDQNYTFNLVAVNMNYFPKSYNLGGANQFNVIADNTSPNDDAKDNIAGTFFFDVRASGPLLNDAYNKNPGYGKDYHGAGSVWREYGRMAHEKLAGDWAATHTRPADAVYWPRAWHDSQCYFPVQSVGTPSDMDYSCDNLADDPKATPKPKTACSDNPFCTWDDKTDPKNPVC